ncbi:MAG: isoprenylcysteine carboxylmethyltransferase family protein [Bacteroidota bacterium]
MPPPKGDGPSAGVERTRGDIRRIVFTYRSFFPLPFLAVMILFARPTAGSLAAGLGAVLLGESLRLWGVSFAGSETRTTGDVGGTYLITGGPFAYVRNPLYLGNMVIYAGVGWMSLALFPWLLIAAAAWFYLQYSLIVAREEEYLAVRFGGEYLRYASRVRRFLPRLTPYRASGPPPRGASLAEGLVSERRTLQALVLVTGILVAVWLLGRGGA